MPKIGVYLCQCEGKISEVLDLEKLQSKILKWKNVTKISVQPSLCRAGALHEIMEDMKSARVDRVLIGACSPAVRRELFLQLADTPGMEQNLIERCNLREQCALAHSTDPDQAFKKALQLARMGVARLRAAEAPENLPRLMTSDNVLVVGGGVAGLTAAENLARAGKQVIMVEKTAYLGGRAARLFRYYPRFCPPGCGLAVQVARLLQTTRAYIFTLTEVKEIQGTAGDFTVTIVQKPRFVSDKCTGCNECVNVCPVTAEKNGVFAGWQKAARGPGGMPYPLAYAIDQTLCTACGKCREICPAQAICLDEEEKTFTVNVGSIIIATGSKMYGAAGIENYGYGKLPGVITSMDMELMANPAGPTGGRLVRPGDSREARRIVFIQCAGSRDQRHLPYCSGICCAVTLKQISYIRNVYSDAQITVFYMDMRTPGHLEEMYQKALTQGTMFIRGNPFSVTMDSSTKDLQVLAQDTLSGRKVLVRSDLVVLATGTVPSPIPDFYRLKKDASGYISGHLPCSPLETERSGIFAAGTIQQPMDIGDTVKSALAASAQCQALFEPLPHALLPVLNKNKCDRCKRCIEECPHKAIIEDVDGYPAISAGACRSCGTCQGGCPLQSIFLPGYSTREVNALFEQINSASDEPQVLAFLCGNDAYRAADAASYPANIFTVMVPCAGAVNMSWLSEALLNGWDGVLVAGCREGQCHYGQGSNLAVTRLNKLKQTLQSMLVEEERVQFLACGIDDADLFAKSMHNFVHNLKQMGPSPFKES